MDYPKINNNNSANNTVKNATPFAYHFQHPIDTKSMQ